MVLILTNENKIKIRICLKNLYIHKLKSFRYLDEKDEKNRNRKLIKNEIIKLIYNMNI